jgi:SAM-dependent methyltransferase
MHAAAMAWLRQFATPEPLTVVDVGGRNINGTPRGLFPAAAYTAVDLQDGPGVDVVADCRQWHPPASVDLVVCCEVLEHAPDPRAVVRSCVDYLKPGGRLVLTCAGPGRAPHSGHDGGGVRPGEHYANISPVELRLWLLAQGLTDLELVDNTVTADVYATGVAP